MLVGDAADYCRDPLDYRASAAQIEAAHGHRNFFCFSELAQYALMLLQISALFTVTIDLASRCFASSEASRAWHGAAGAKSARRASAGSGNGTANGAGHGAAPHAAEPPSGVMPSKMCQGATIPVGIKLPLRGAPGPQIR